MSPLIIMAALCVIVLCAITYGCIEARFNAYDHDWREDWCVPECYADHKQQGPCNDCPARRAARRWHR